MTPTTITHADELAKAAEEHLQMLNECGVATDALLKAIAAYRAARSTDGACEDSARLDWLEKSGGSLTARAKERERYDMGTFWEWSGFEDAYTGKTVRAAIDAARAASGTGEAG